MPAAAARFADLSMDERIKRVRRAGHLVAVCPTKHVLPSLTLVLLGTLRIVIADFNRKWIKLLCDGW